MVDKVGGEIECAQLNGGWREEIGCQRMGCVHCVAANWRRLIKAAAVEAI